MTNQLTIHLFGIKETVIRHLSVLLNEKNKKINLTVFIECLIIISYKNDYLKSFYSCYFLVWTIYTCMAEPFEMFIALY